MIGVGIMGVVFMLVGAAIHANAFNQGMRSVMDDPTEAMRARRPPKWLAWMEENGK